MQKRFLQKLEKGATCYKSLKVLEQLRPLHLRGVIDFNLEHHDQLVYCSVYLNVAVAKKMQTDSDMEEDKSAFISLCLDSRHLNNLLNKKLMYNSNGLTGCYEQFI